MGSTDFTAPNPPFGATFTYHLAEVPPTEHEARRAAEKDLRERGQDAPFPGWDQLRREAGEREPRVFLTVRDAQGEAIRRLEGPAEEGLHRVSWDLRRPPPDPIDLETPGFTPPWMTPPRGPLVRPGRYRVELALLSSAGVQPLGAPQEFEVKAVPSAPSGTDFDVVAEFQQAASDVMRRVAGAGEEIERVREALRHMRAALIETPQADPELFTRVDEMEASLDELQTRLTGDPVRARLNEASQPSIRSRVALVISGHWGTRQMPTKTQRENLEIARARFAELDRDLTALIEDELSRLETDLTAAGAPWTPGARQ